MKNENLDMSLLLDFYGEVLTYRQREMLELYYDDDLSLSEISEQSGITRQGVRDAIKRAEKQLFEMESKLKLVERFGRIRNIIGEISQHAENIYNINRGGVCSEEINRSAIRIARLAEELSAE